MNDAGKLASFAPLVVHPYNPNYLVSRDRGIMVAGWLGQRHESLPEKKKKKT
jgi:hypothetical protein